MTRHLFVTGLCVIVASISSACSSDDKAQPASSSDPLSEGTAATRCR